LTPPAAEIPIAAMAPSLETCAFFGVPVARIATDDFVRRVLDAAATRPETPMRVGYLNAHTANMAWEDADFRRTLAGFDIVYADGMGVVRACARLGRPLPERVNAGDFVERLLWACRERGIRVALVGSRSDVVEQCRRTLAERAAGNAICFAHHGHFAPGGAEERELLLRLREARPDIVLVGMGSPRQEQWTRDHADRTGAAVVWCVGALFEYYAGRGRAPAWMREAGLEWLCRLALEPRRLAGRYLFGNALFAWRVWRWR